MGTNCTSNVVSTDPIFSLNVRTASSQVSSNVHALCVNGALNPDQVRAVGSLNWTFSLFGLNPQDNWYKKVGKFTYYTTQLRKALINKLKRLLEIHLTLILGRIHTNKTTCIYLCRWSVRTCFIATNCLVFCKQCILFTFYTCDLPHFVFLWVICIWTNPKWVKRSPEAASAKLLSLSGCFKLKLR